MDKEECRGLPYIGRKSRGKEIVESIQERKNNIKIKIKLASSRKISQIAFGKLY